MRWRTATACSRTSRAGATTTSTGRRPTCARSGAASRPRSLGAGPLEPVLDLPVVPGGARALAPRGRLRRGAAAERLALAGGPGRLGLRRGLRHVRLGHPMCLAWPDRRSIRAHPPLQPAARRLEDLLAVGMLGGEVDDALAEAGALDRTLGGA